MECFRFAALEAGAKDTSEFDKWQSEMKQKDLDAQLFEIERRRLAGKLSHEEAILARQELVTDNKQKVQAMKDEVYCFFFVFFFCLEDFPSIFLPVPRIRKKNPKIKLSYKQNNYDT